MRRCDTPKCPNSAHRLYTIAPGTSVWLCKVCIYMETKGLEVLNLDGHPETGSGQTRIPDHDPEEVFKFAVENCRADADALLCSCTDWRALEVVERLEQRLGKPVVAANQATIWLVARQLRIEGPINGFGSLLSEHLALVPAE